MLYWCYYDNDDCDSDTMPLMTMIIMMLRRTLMIMMSLTTLRIMMLLTTMRIMI